jgi:hypothetical protein
MDKFDLPVWSSDDVTSLLLIDFDAATGITNLLKFLIQNKGYVKDSTMDLMFVISSVVLFGQNNHVFKDAERIVSIATEFCLIDTVKDNQTLEAIGLSDNSVLYLALQDETDAALEAAVCLSAKKGSVMQETAIRPAISLYGRWEDRSIGILDLILTKGKRRIRISELRDMAVGSDLDLQTDLEFVDFIRKLCTVGLLDTTINKKGSATVSINEEAAGLFLVFSGNVDLAKTLVTAKS